MGDIADEHVIVSTTSSRVKLSKRLKARNRQILFNPCHVQCNCKPKASGFWSSTSGDEGNSNNDDNHGMICSIPSHAVFVFLDPLLLGVIQVEFQSKSKSPLETHPVNMWIFLLAICFYSTVLGVKKSKLRFSLGRRGNYDQLLNNILLVFGSLSSASLLSILLPRLFLVWFLIIIWASLPAILARHFLKLLFRWIWCWIVSFGVCCNFNISSWMNRSEEEDLPK